MDNKGSDHSQDDNAICSWRPNPNAPGAKEWFAASAQQEQKPLGVNCGEIYTVQYGDSLSTIAERALKDDGKSNPSWDDISSEMDKIVKDNDQKYKTLDCNKDYIQTGWQLEIPCEVKPPECEPKPQPCEVKPPECEPKPQPCEVKPPECEPKPQPCEPQPQPCIPCETPSWGQNGMGNYWNGMGGYGYGGNGYQYQPYQLSNYYGVPDMYAYLGGGTQAQALASYYGTPDMYLYYQTPTTSYNYPTAYSSAMGAAPGGPMGPGAVSSEYTYAPNTTSFAPGGPVPFIPGGPSEVPGNPAPASDTTTTNITDNQSTTNNNLG